MNIRLLIQKRTNIFHSLFPGWQKAKEEGLASAPLFRSINDGQTIKDDALMKMKEIQVVCSNRFLLPQFICQSIPVPFRCANDRPSETKESEIYPKCSIVLPPWQDGESTFTSFWVWEAPTSRRRDRGIDLAQKSCVSANNRFLRHIVIDTKKKNSLSMEIKMRVKHEISLSVVYKKRRRRRKVYGGPTRNGFANLDRRWKWTFTCQGVGVGLPTTNFS